MDNHEEETKHAVAQSRAGEAGANLTDVLAAVAKLAEQWEGSGAWMNNPHDHPEDRAAGRAYQSCAKELRTALEAANKPAKGLERSDSPA